MQPLWHFYATLMAFFRIFIENINKEVAMGLIKLVVGLVVGLVALIVGIVGGALGLAFGAVVLVLGLVLVILAVVFLAPLGILALIF